MSRLPMPGDAQLAVRAFNGRVEAAVGANEENPTVYVGDTRVNLADAEMDGPGAQSLRMVYGDLFDIAEVTAAGGAELAARLVGDLRKGETDLFSSLLQLYLQGMGVGVLMERQRWERERAREGS